MFDHRERQTIQAVKMNRVVVMFFILTLACLTISTMALGQGSKDEFSDESLLRSGRADFNREIYFKHKLEFSLDAGWLPNNMPFIFNPLMGETWARTPLDYTLVPLIVSLRWHWGNVAGPSFIRGNTDLTFSGSYTVIPRGPSICMRLSCLAYDVI